MLKYQVFFFKIVYKKIYIKYIISIIAAEVFLRVKENLLNI